MENHQKNEEKVVKIQNKNKLLKTKKLRNKVSGKRSSSFSSKRNEEVSLWIIFDLDKAKSTRRMQVLYS